MKSIGENIRKYRKANNMRQEDLAEKTDLSSNYIGMIERGEKIPALDTFINIANVLNVSSDMLLCEKITKSAEIKSCILSEKIEKLSKEDKQKIFEIIETFIKLSK